MTNLPKDENGKPKRGPGRPPGAQNKTTIQVKQALLACYDSIGGDSKFAEWARENATEFYKLWVKILPQEVSGPDGGPIEYKGIAREIIRSHSPADS